jgi:hypothetical protein
VRTEPDSYLGAASAVLSDGPAARRAVARPFVPRIDARVATVLDALDRAVYRGSSWIDAHPGIFLTLFSLIFLAGTGSRAWLRPLWFDELLAFNVASQPTLRDIWSALRTGVDLHPPLHHVLSHFSMLAAGAGPWGLRLPALVGFLVMELCIFWFVARRTTPLYGAVALVLTLSTSAFDYAAQGRPYGLMLGLGALALVAWQSAAGESPRRTAWLAALALALAGAISTSYHAALVFVPVAVGEATRSWLRRRIDWPVWLAIGAGALTLLLYLPLLWTPLGYLPTHPHRPGLEKALDVFTILLTPALVPMLIAGLLLACYPQRDRAAPYSVGPTDTGFCTHELAAMLACCLLPFVSLALAYASHGGTFLWVYVLPTTMGLSLLAANLLFRYANQRHTVAALIVLVFLGWFSLRQVSPVAHALARSRTPPAAPVLLRGLDVRLPVVIADPILFLQLAHYQPPELVGRLFFLTDLDQVVRFTEQDSGERSLQHLNMVRRIPLEPYQAFIQTHRAFHVYWTGKRWEWLLSKLIEDGARVEVVQERQDELVLLVTVPTQPLVANGAPLGIVSDPPASHR